VKDIRLFRSSRGAHLFVVDGSRVYDLDTEAAARVERALSGADEGAARALLNTLDLDASGRGGRISRRPLPPPPLRAISLNVAQTCNLACHYCYADEGRFGGRARMMSREVAEAAIDTLLREAEPGATVVVGFMGGEPLLNRDVVHHATRYAARVGTAAGRRVRFSITTNGTLIKGEDAALFSEFPFTVQVSVDGPRAVHDAARPTHDGRGSYDRLIAGLQNFEQGRRPRHLSGRVTVTPRTGDLASILDHLLGLGFDEVGFAAVLVSPSPSMAFSHDDFATFLSRMIVCGERALARMLAGARSGFANLETALVELHRGSHRPYPCGAGAAYLSANAEGKLYACHRLVDDAAFSMGDVRRGSDLAARSRHLVVSHVDRMEPCRDCWARYLCGGGCYHEVRLRGRPGCDYIRGWLEFCVRAYVEVSTAHPEYFGDPELLANPTIAPLI